MTVGPEFAKLIWLPDTYITNSKEVKGQMTAATDRDLLIEIKANGDITYSTRFTVTASCAMNLRRFPMDDQICMLEFSSYGYSVSDVFYNWLNTTNILKKTVNLPEFDLLGEKRYLNDYIGSTGKQHR